MTKRAIFYYSININYDRCITLSYGRILTALFSNQDISNFLLVNQNLIPTKTHFVVILNQGDDHKISAVEGKMKLLVIWWQPPFSPSGSQ